MNLERVPLTIRSGKQLHRFTVQVAASFDEQEKGLMFRTDLGPDEGMIFPLRAAQNITFWMKNTLIPLDIIFIREDGTIARITTAKPLDLSPVPAGEPVTTVLEINGGRAAALGIRSGDHVSWPPLPVRRR